MNFKITTSVIQEQEITIPCFPYFAANEDRTQAICIHSETRCTHIFKGGKDLMHYYISGGGSNSFNKAFDKGWSTCSADDFRELFMKLMENAIYLNIDHGLMLFDRAPASAEDASLNLNLQNPEGDE